MDIQEHCYQQIASELNRKYRERDAEVSTMLLENDENAIRERGARIRALLQGSLRAELPECPLSARVTGNQSFGSYRIENVIIQTLPGCYLPVNLYCPVQGDDPFPAVVVPIGHWPAGKSMEENQILCANLAMQGFLVATYDPLCQGERAPFSHQELLRRYGDIPEDMHAVTLHMIPGNLFYLMGENLMSLFLRDGQRVIDYLCTRPDVDPQRIGVTGQSGGGTQTTFLAALDERVCVYSPIQCMSRQSLVVPKRGIGDCEQSLLSISKDIGFDYADILYAALDKPVMLNCGLRDMFYIEGVRAIEAEMSLVHALLNHKEAFCVRTADCGHVITAPTRMHAYRFLNETLRGCADELQESAISLQDSAALACLTRDCQAGSPLTAAQYLLEQAKRHRPTDPTLQRTQLESLLQVHSRPATQETLLNGVRLLHVAGARSISYVPAAKADIPLCLWIGPCPKKNVLSKYLRIVEASPWAMQDTLNKHTHGYDHDTMLFNAAAISGEWIMADRVNEVLALADHLCAEENSTAICLVGNGYGALVALLAAAVSTCFQKTILIGLPASLDAMFYDDSYLLPETLILPGLPRIGDIPDLIRLSQNPLLCLAGTDTRWQPAESASDITAQIVEFLQ